MKFVAGLDGGGTKTAAAVADASGRVVHSFVAGAINANGHHEQEIAATVRQIFGEIAAACGGDLDACAHVCIGAAGISNPAARERLVRLVRASGYRGGLSIVGDHETALCGAHGRRQGIILIAGTGSICFGINAAGESHRTGGYGHLVDDAGSGYSIGRDLIAALIRASDGRAPATVITELVYERLGITGVRQLVEYVYDKRRNKRDIAALAPLLADACAAGDPLAMNIARDNAEALVQLVVPVAEKLELTNGELAYAGGVLLHNAYVRDLLTASLARRCPAMTCYPAKSDAVRGALWMALDAWNNGRTVQP